MMGNNPGALLTAKDVIDDKDLIKKTGANSGIGRETARVFVKACAHVVIAARDIIKSETVKKEILAEVKGASEEKIIVLPLDLGDFASIDEFVDSFIKLKLSLHILVCNAGVMMTPLKKTKDDKKKILKKKRIRVPIRSQSFWSFTDGQKRIVILSSRGHLRELNRRLTRDFGAENFLCCSVHPGVIQTGLQGGLSPAKKFLIMTAMRVTQGIKTVEQGAATTMYGSVSDKIKGGEYLADYCVKQQKEDDFQEKEIKVETTKTKHEDFESREEVKKRVGVHILAQSIKKENHEEFYRAIGFSEKYLKGFIEKPVAFETIGDKDGYDLKLISPLSYEVSGKWGEEDTLEPLCITMSVVMGYEKEYKTIDEKEGLYYDEFHYGSIVARTIYQRTKL
eukprot:gene1341-11423_t